MNGLEVIETMRDSDKSSNPFVPIIMLSAYSTQANVSEARDVGVTEFVIKPFSPKSLFSRIQAVIETPRPFIQARDFFGPDRRRQNIDLKFSDRRKRDPEMDQSMSQDKVDSLVTTPAEEEEEKSGTSYAAFPID